MEVGGITVAPMATLHKFPGELVPGLHYEPSATCCDLDIQAQISLLMHTSLDGCKPQAPISQI